MKEKFRTDDRTRIDTEALKETASQQFGTSDINVSSTTLDKLAALGSVEGFPLAHPCEDNNYCGVSLYLDEAGQLKHLPLNTRARSLASLCGFKDVPLVGDMYVGRTRRELPIGFWIDQQWSFD